MNVCISGGGVAGLAAAFWLDRTGAKVTVLERVQGYQPLGHFIALKAKGIQTVKRMGMFEGLEANAVHAAHLKVFSRSGALLREGGSDGMEKTLDGYLLIKRAVLHAQLYEAVKARGLVHLGTELEAIVQSDDGVEVTAGGTTTRYDLLIGADGIHSRTRELVFGGGHLTPLGGSYLAMNIPGPHGLTTGTVEAYLGQGQSVGLIPATEQELTVMVYHADGGLPMPDPHDQGAMRTFLSDAYRDFPEHVRAAFGRLGESSFVYRDVIAQVQLPEIVKGRVALIGDAAHCPTFLSGMGSSLALQGAHALAQSLEAHPSDLTLTLAAYQQQIAPIAAQYQKSAQLARPFLLSRNPVVRAVRDAAVKHVPEWVLELETRRFYRATQEP